MQSTCANSSTSGTGADVERVRCWHCGYPSADAAVCEWCRADLAPAEELRELVLKLAERIYLAHEILARRAEKEPTPDTTPAPSAPGARGFPPGRATL